MVGRKVSSRNTMNMKKFFKSLYVADRLYYIAGVLIVLFVIGYYFTIIYAVAKAAAITFAAVLLIDVLLLYNSSKFSTQSKRHVP
jgi:cobalamin biosynthesis protein CobD/CbiB